MAHWFRARHSSPYLLGGVAIFVLVGFTTLYIVMPSLHTSHNDQIKQRAALARSTSLASTEFQSQSATLNAAQTPQNSPTTNAAQHTAANSPITATQPGSKSKAAGTSSAANVLSSVTPSAVVSTPAQQQPSHAVAPTTYPTQVFEVATSQPVRTDQATTITYTMTLTIEPIVSDFGNPSITAHIYNANACSNTDSLSKTMQYSAINDTISLSCVVQRIPPYVAGNPNPPPTTDTAFTIEVTGNLADGQYIYGNSDISYSLPYGYNQ
jgi:hypothetical protein